jgi:aminomethyltransferase
MNMTLRASPFHVRIALHNHANAWVARGAYTAPARFGDPRQEALAARFSCVLADLSALEEMRVEGAGAADLIATACGASVRAMDAGESRHVHWCAEGGGLRGIGTLLREREDMFVLRGEDADIGWFLPHAARFRTAIAATGAERGLLLLAGPFANAVLSEAGLDLAETLEPDRHMHHAWNGIDVVLSREVRLNAFLVSCPADEGVIVFDRLFRAGKTAGLRLAGQEAVDLLALEAGLILPHRDFQPARESIARSPLPSSLGIGAASTASRVLAGIEFDGDEPFAFAPLLHEGKEAGMTLRSAYSPALRRAIALAQVDAKFAAPGTLLRVKPGEREVGSPARVTALPFL